MAADGRPPYQVNIRVVQQRLLANPNQLEEQRSLRSFSRRKFSSSYEAGLQFEERGKVTLAIDHWNVQMQEGSARTYQLDAVTVGPISGRRVLP